LGWALCIPFTVPQAVAQVVHDPRFGVDQEPRTRRDSETGIARRHFFGQVSLIEQA
jgi:hypothetical protein